MYEGYSFLSPLVRKESNVNARQHPPVAAKPCPIPRNGIPGTPGVVLHILLLLATAMVGVGISAMRTTSETEVQVAEFFSIATLVILIVYLWRVSRSAKGLLPVLVVAGIALSYLTNSAIPAAVLLGVIFAVSEGSLLLAVSPKEKLTLFPLILMAAYAVTTVLSRDPVGSLAVLVPFPAMLVLAWGTRHSAAREDGLTRVGVICATSLALGLSMAAMITLSVYRVLGTLEPTALMEGMEALRVSIIEAFVNTEIPPDLNPEAIAELEEMLTYSNVENMVNGVFNLLPALAVVAVNLLSITAQTLQHAALRTFGFEASITERVRAFRMSLIACIVFLGAYLVTFLEGSDASTLTGTVAQNIYIILLPGLALAGLLRIMTGLAKKGPRGLGCLFYLVLLLPCLFLFAPFLFAAVEVIGHIVSSITSTLKPPDDDDDLFGRPPKNNDND